MMLRPYYDEEKKEWRCVIDEFTTIVADTKDKLEDSLDFLENYIRVYGYDKSLFASR